MARVCVLKETTTDKPGDWTLWLQWCRFELDDGDQFGYRFIWRRPDGTLQAARGQARIPSFEAMTALMEKASSEGWGDRDADKIKPAVERLEKQGCVVTLSTGYVGWPNAATARENNVSPELIEDARLLREWA